MNTQGFNPYLPSWEYVPDGEPHVFGNRVYVFGSHDRFNGYAFCMNDYICYSADITDLKNWKYEGVIYERNSDPENTDGEMCLYAPDVTRGPDGRYYLYYVLSGLQVVSVAVSETPAGHYEFYGYVHYLDGTRLGEKYSDEPQFDPGVLVENNQVYLYTGACPPDAKERTGPKVTVLASDMLTVLEEPRTVAPSKPYSAGTGYEGNEFFEAASIRKVGKKYYFIYSSIQYHNLCYAVSDSPLGGFDFGGTIVSNVDLGISTYKDKDRPMAFIDNNHGSIEYINGQWYVFYHRHTNGNSYSRQGCIEPIEILKDGTIPQVEITSSGPNGAPLNGYGYYPAYIACHIYCNTNIADVVGMTHPGKKRDARFPYLTQDGKDGDEYLGYVANMDDGATAGFKYFECKNTRVVEIKVRGWCKGRYLIMNEPDGEILGSIEVKLSNEWKCYTGNIKIPDGVQSLYFQYSGYGSANLAGFTLRTEE